MKNITFIIAAFFTIFYAYKGECCPLKVYDLECETMNNPLGINTSFPRFSWKLSSHTNGEKETAYEIQLALDSLDLSTGRNLIYTSGKFKSSNSVLVSLRNLHLDSRTLCYWRVRVWNKGDKVSRWSSIAKFSVGLLSSTEFRGSYIGMNENMKGMHSPLLRKKFFVDKLSSTFIHVNSFGYHEIWINGRKVGLTVLAPSVSQLDKRSHIVTYDITPYLHRGQNDLVIWLGRGWFKYDTFHAFYGGPIVKAEIDQWVKNRWSTICVTDSSWKASPSGYEDTGTWQPLRFGGELVDGRILPHNFAEQELDSREWTPVSIVNVKDIIPTPQMCEGNRIVSVTEAISVKRLSDNSLLVDMGRVLTGWLKVTMHNMKRGDTLSIEYTDHIDAGKTFQSIGESDQYISSGLDSEKFCNKFIHHAFRYARIINFSGRFKSSDFLGLQISMTGTPSACFECSDSDLNAIHNMIQYTLRSLTFSGYQVDCPHLERMGYGGDGNSSTMSTQTMFDVQSTYYNWLEAWGDVISDDGSLPYVAPAGGGGGGPYWSGFMVKAPWRCWLNYADDRMMIKRYGNMKAWLGYVKSYMKDGLLQPWPDTKNRMWFLADWLSPIGTDPGNHQSVIFANNCFISDCLHTMSLIARHLGKTEDAQKYALWHNQLNKVLQGKFYHPQDSTYASGSVLDMSYAMLVGVVPSNVYGSVMDKLVSESYQQYHAHIACGLMGVPIFTEWAIKNRQVNLMYDILKKKDYPGYLYMIENGATTTWEAWNGDRSRVHNCYNGVAVWFYQAMGGLLTSENNDGYKHIIIYPQCPKNVSWVKVSKESPYGTINVSWIKDPKELHMKLSIPVGCQAHVRAPEGYAVKSEPYYRLLLDESMELESGNYNLIFIKK